MEGKAKFGRTRCRLKDNIKVDLRETLVSCDSEACKHDNALSDSIMAVKFLD
jgi:hypothetical protein